MVQGAAGEGSVERLLFWAFIHSFFPLVSISFLFHILNALEGGGEQLYEGEQEIGQEAEVGKWKCQFPSHTPGPAPLPPALSSQPASNFQEQWFWCFSQVSQILFSQLRVPPSKCSAPDQSGLESRCLSLVNGSCVSENVRLSGNITWQVNTFQVYMPLTRLAPTGTFLWKAASFYFDLTVSWATSGTLLGSSFQSMACSFGWKILFFLSIFGFLFLQSVFKDSIENKSVCGCRGLAVFFRPLTCYFMAILGDVGVILGPESSPHSVHGQKRESATSLPLAQLQSKCFISFLFFLL